MARRCPRRRPRGPRAGDADVPAECRRTYAVFGTHLRGGVDHPPTDRRRPERLVLTQPPHSRDQPARYELTNEPDARVAPDADVCAEVHLWMRPESRNAPPHDAHVAHVQRDQAHVRATVPAIGLDVGRDATPN